MKKIIALVLAMVITAALWAGGTAAYASMFVTSTPNITVKLEGDGVSKNLDAPDARWEPGFTTFTNFSITGDVAYTWALNFTGDTAQKQDQQKDLAEVIDVYWAPTVDVAGCTRTAAVQKMKRIGTLKELIDGDTDLSATVDQAGTTNITIVLKMRESAGNDYQDASASFQFTVTVTAKNTSVN